MFIKFIKRLFNIKKTFEFTPYVHLDVFNNPVEHQTSKVLLLKKITVDALSEKKAIEEAFKHINSNYPQLKGKIHFQNTK